MLRHTSIPPHRRCKTVGPVQPPASCAACVGLARLAWTFHSHFWLYGAITNASRPPLVGGVGGEKDVHTHSGCKRVGLSAVNPPSPLPSNPLPPFPPSSLPPRHWHWRALCAASLSSCTPSPSPNLRTTCGPKIPVSFFLTHSHSAHLLTPRMQMLSYFSHILARSPCCPAT